MSDLISRQALLAEYDRVHVGPPGGARKEALREEEAVEAIPVRWIVENFIKDRPADESVDFMMMINKWREERA